MKCKTCLIVVLLLLCESSVFALAGYGVSNTFGITEETLPVELSSFTATTIAHNYVQLTWVTQSETNLWGYYVYRGTANELNSAVLLSDLIHPTNTSSQQSYSYIDSEIFESGQYFYWLQSLEIDDNGSYHGPISIIVNLEGGDPDSPGIPLKTGLRAIYPNPFNPSTTISYQLKTPEQVSISIYNTRGQIVHSITRSHSVGGYYSVIYDAKDAPSGVYYVIMTAGKYCSSQKIVLMK